MFIILEDTAIYINQVCPYLHLDQGTNDRVDWTCDCNLSGQWDVRSRIFKNMFKLFGKLQAAWLWSDIHSEGGFGSSLCPFDGGTCFAWLLIKSQLSNTLPSPGPLKQSQSPLAYGSHIPPRPDRKRTSMRPHPHTSDSLTQWTMEYRCLYVRNMGVSCWSCNMCQYFAFFG